MLFDKGAYYRKIKRMELVTNFCYVICAIAGAYISYCIKHTGINVIIGTIIGLIIAKIYSENTELKIEKMKWEFDIYNKIMEK